MYASTCGLRKATKQERSGHEKRVGRRHIIAYPVVQGSQYRHHSGDLFLFLTSLQQLFPSCLFHYAALRYLVVCVTNAICRYLNADSRKLLANLSIILSSFSQSAFCLDCKLHSNLITWALGFHSRLTCRTNADCQVEEHGCCRSCAGYPNIGNDQLPDPLRIPSVILLQSRILSLPRPQCLLRTKNTP